MNRQRILIIAPAWVGDLVISLSFINALKKIHKDSEIDFARARVELAEAAAQLQLISKLRDKINR